MKTYILLIALILAVAFAQTNTGAGSAAPGRKVPADPFEQTNSQEVLEQLQGNVNDVFIVLFYVDDAARQAVADKIQSDVIGKGHEWVRYTEVDLTKSQDYYELFNVFELEDEPKRGHTEPQALIMSRGEGFLIRGPNIVDSISKTIGRVENRNLYQ